MVRGDGSLFFCETDHSRALLVFELRGVRFGAVRIGQRAAWGWAALEVHTSSELDVNDFESVLQVIRHPNEPEISKLASRLERIAIYSDFNTGSGSRAQRSGVNRSSGPAVGGWQQFGASAERDGI